ncbi:MAG: DNA adenine methylase [Cyanobacteria bacterium P01_G01_bin.54]
MPGFGYTYKSPLRYPGGKQRDVRFLGQYLHPCREFREPFLGGGSVLLYALKHHIAQQYWGNDLNPAVAVFWQQVKVNAQVLGDRAWSLRDPYNGPRKNSPQWQAFRQQFTDKLNTLPLEPLEQAARFFILNRSTSGGATESGGLTAGAYCDRFTASSIETLKALQGRLDRVKLTNLDYAELLQEPGEQVFIFLDPPYLSAERSGLYGKAGDLHRGFDHQRLTQTLKNCGHDWLMTIDDCPEVRQLYNWAHQRSWQKSYGMTNTGGRKSKRGAELLVANFPLDSV